MILDLRLAFGFLTRVPVKTPPTLPEGAMARALWAFPLVGAFIGSVSAAVFLIAQKAFSAFSGWPPALLGIAAGILLTGALHEDGFADCADGFGGGRDKDAKLAIMRDSRIGAYGALALLFSVLLRASALVGLHHPLPALVITCCLGRTALPLAMRLTRPATSTGVAAGVGPVPWWSVIIALLIGSGATFGLYGENAYRPLLAALLAAVLMALLAKRQIGGYTGDVLGATEQLVEIFVLLSILPLP